MNKNSIAKSWLKINDSMEHKTLINNENGNNANRLLVAVVDKQVKQLSDMQL